MKQAFQNCLDQSDALSSLQPWALWHPTQMSSLQCRQPNHSRRQMSDSQGKHKAGLQKAICPHWLERSKYSCPFPLCVQSRSLHSRRIEAARDLPVTQHRPCIDGSFLLSRCEGSKNPTIRTEVFVSKTLLGWRTPKGLESERNKKHKTEWNEMEVINTG